MTILAKVGEFSISPAWSLYSYPIVDCVGWEPKIALFFYTRTTASGNVLQNEPGNTYNFGVSVASTRTIGRFGIETAAWNGAPSESYIGKGSFNSKVINITQSGTIWSTDGFIDFDRFTASGFRFYVTDVPSQYWKVSYLALGGDSITNVFSQTKARPRHNIASGIEDPGFQPDALFMLSADYSNNFYSNSVQDFSVGLADRELNQGQVYHGYTDYGSSPTHAYGHSSSGEISAAIWYGDYEPRNDNPQYFVDTIQSLDTNGFTLYHYPIPSGIGLTYSASYFHYLVMKGGMWKVGSLTTRADTTDIEVELGFRPSAVIFISSTKEQDGQYSFSQAGTTSFGVATSPTERGCITVWNGYVPTISGMPLNVASAKYKDIVYANIASGTLVSSMDLTSINDTGFVCKMNNFESQENKFILYMACGLEVPTEITPIGNDQPTVYMI